MLSPASSNWSTKGSSDSHQRQPPLPALLDGKLAVLERITIARNHHQRPSSSSPHSSNHRLHHSKRRGRPATSRVRGKHGLVKSINSYSGHCFRANTMTTTGHGRNDSDSNNDIDVDGMVDGPFNKETRSAHLKHYIQSRRLRLRQRLLLRRQQQQRHVNPFDASDVSLDEADILDDNDDDGDVNMYLDDGNGRLDEDNVFALNQGQYRHYMWELEQQLWERTESAAKSRSHFLMERRMSAGERVGHALRVVQRQRTEQELRQHRARDELEQKMVRAMARRNAYLEAAIENDPSRRFRRKSISPAATAAGAVSTKINPSAASAAAPLSSVRRDCRVLTATATATTTAVNQGPAKNSPVVNMIHTTTTKKHLTNMTSRTTSMSPSVSTSVLQSTGSDASAEDSSSSSKSCKNNSKNNENRAVTHDSSVGMDVNTDTQGVEKTTLWAQHKICYRLAQKALREYMTAIGGSHVRVLAMRFDELARLLHTNKGLIQATLKLLKYSSQLVQMDDARRGIAMPRRTFKNPARVFLSMYMVLAHPSKIRSPTEPTPASSDTGADQIDNNNDDAFESLVESSKALLEALQTWLDANLKPHAEAHQPDDSSHATPESTSATSLTEDNNASLVHNFDQAWTSYFHFFEAWKDKDAKRLLQTLLDHAQQTESLWRTVQTDPSARTEWEPRIEEQRRDLRAKAAQLAGPEGTARLDAVFADFVNATTITPTITVTTTASSMASTSAASSSAADAHSGTSATTAAAVSPQTVKKRQRATSVCNTDEEMASTAESSDNSTRISAAKEVPSTSSATNSSTSTPAATVTAATAADQQPKAKKSANAKSPDATVTSIANTSTEDIMSAMPLGLERPTQWTNLQVIHELALDANFKIERRRPPGTAVSSSAASTSTSGLGSDDGLDEDAASAEPESLEARIKAMATKAYFDKIREDAEQGKLGKWIPSILTTIREHLMDMVPAESAMAAQVTEAFDLEFVQQQVDRQVYDMKAALEGVVMMMSRLCAPIRDAKIRKLQEDLKLVEQNPFLGRAATPTPPSATTDDTADVETSSSSTKYSATSVTPKDLVSVLQDVLQLLEVMLLDLANFRLTVARPRLEKEAIPYEQKAFRESLDEDEFTLDSTNAWLQESAATRLSSRPSSLVLAATTAVGGEAYNFRSNNKYYEILVQGLLDLIFSKKHFDVSPDKEQFPATLALDVERLMRYQNEVQGLALVAVMLNIAHNVPPKLKEEDQVELKKTLLKLIESPRTSRETLSEAIVEAKERALLLASRASSGSSSMSPSSSTAGLLLTEEQRSYINNTLAKAISFDSTLFTVLSQRLRRVLEFYLLSTVNPITSATTAANATTSTSGGNGEKRAGAMPEQAELNKMGLGALAAEMEQLASQIRFLAKYNAQVYREWYDPMLTNILAQQQQQQ
ncbi:T-complex protein 11 [Dissophora ornata]|nr:T-complex protein 11 [Dissophora ornata]